MLLKNNMVRKIAERPTIQILDIEGIVDNAKENSVSSAVRGLVK